MRKRGASGRRHVLLLCAVNVCMLIVIQVECSEASCVLSARFQEHCCIHAV
jgi:hypothetical protein